MLTHGAGMLFGLTAIIVLMIAGIRTGDPWVIGSFAVYALCMTSSYVTSTFYHAASDPKRKCQLRRWDHSAIYLHIAGTYTPFTLVALRDEGFWGWGLFITVWLAAVIGVWFSFRRMKKKDNLKTVCYLLMSWVLIGGGLFYSLGTIFFFLDKYKYMHSAWHLFVLGGTVCHFIAIYNLV